MEEILKTKAKSFELTKKPLVWIYQKGTLKMDKDMVQALAEYSNLKQKEVVWLLKRAERLNAALWRILNPKTEKEIEEFYSNSPFYIFELAFWHMKRHQRRFRTKIIKEAEGRVLDFGGGVGDLCIELAKRGLVCDYADLEGRIFDFAHWLFKKRGLNVNMINLSRAGLLKTYDTIFCLDVIEHTPKPKEMLKELTAHLAGKGRLIITNLNASVLKKHPMHFPIKFDGEKYLNSLGLSKAKEPWLWIKSY